jgi:ArsR family transcriptional regulator, arsenate/arsenite/antimonite-responsive transcriptional repressor
MSVSKKVVLSGDQVQLIAKALADPRRYQILRQLGDHEKALDCGSVRECIEVSPATLSHHMKELKIAGLVKEVRNGKFVSYILQRDVLEAFFERLRTDLI